MRTLSILLMAVLMAGCRSSKINRSVAVSHTDSTVVSLARIDSLVSHAEKRDSVFVRDSIFIMSKGDTVYKYRERETTRLLYDFGRQRNIVELRDTCYIARRDTVRTTTERVVYRTAWYDRLQVRALHVVMLAAIAWSVFLYLRRRRER